MSTILNLVAAGPVDILRLILEQVAITDRRDALALLYVCRTFKRWCVQTILNVCLVY